MTKKSLVISGTIVTLGLLAGRFTGFLRELLIAQQFGLTEQADVAILLLTLPDTFINFLIGGGVAAALIPTLKITPLTEWKKICWQSSGLFFLFFSLLSVLITINPLIIVHFFAPGASNSVSTNAANLLRIAIWVMPLTALSMVSSAYLQAQERFLMPSLGTFIFNLTIISSFMFISSNYLQMRFFAFAIVLGAFFRWVSQARFLEAPRKVFSPWLVSKSLLTRYVHAVSGLGLIVFLPVAANSLASFYQTGSIAAFSYVNKLIQFPITMCLSVFSIVLLPRLAALGTSDAKNSLALLNART
ncbi:MAG: lipid II flippase MurJ, partial [bacterium]|nr:lipid II flippase MurJ [bacterium]